MLQLGSFAARQAKAVSLRRFLGIFGVSAVVFASVPSFASSYESGKGFVCTSVDEDIRIEITYSTSGDAEARETRVETMAVFDPNVSPKRQLIAKFSAVDGLLNNRGNMIVASVDLTHPDSSRKGERIGGTVLGSLSMIVVDIDFSYQESVNDGTQLSAIATYVKRNGEELTQDLDCIRYLSSFPAR